MAWAALIPLAISAISAGYKAYTGMRQKKKANQLQADNPRPDYDIQKEYEINQRLGQSQAQQGFTAQTRDYYNTQAERGLGSSIGAVLAGGGNVNTIGDAYRTYLDSARAEEAADSQQQAANIQRLIQNNTDLAGQKTMQWAIDKYEPYKDAAKAAAQERAAGDTNISNAIGEAGSAVSSYLTSKLYEDDRAKDLKLQGINATPVNRLPTSSSVRPNVGGGLNYINPNAGGSMSINPSYAASQTKDPYLWSLDDWDRYYNDYQQQFTQGG